MIQETPNKRNSKIILLSDLLSVLAGRQSLVSFCFQLTLYICFIQWMYSGEIVLSRSHHLFQEFCSVSHLYNHFNMGGMEASLENLYLSAELDIQKGIFHHHRHCSGCHRQGRAQSSRWRSLATMSAAICMYCFLSKTKLKTTTTTTTTILSTLRSNL